jgi:SAM-dependent methyltransferase
MLYPDPTRRDPVVLFTKHLVHCLHPSHVVVDLGAGAGLNNAYCLRTRVMRMVGVDIDPRVKSNPLIDEGIVSDICDIPCESNSFDVAFSIYVLEHLADPEKFTREVHRILRPGGVYWTLTPNRWHYVPLVSALTPTSFHKWLNRRRGRQEDDTFPTYYRMNSRPALRKYFTAAGFDPLQLFTIEVQPNYLVFSVPTFLLGTLYERVVNATDWLSAFRVNIIGAFRKR